MLKMQEQSYDICNIYNIDESGFGIRISQMNYIVVDATIHMHWKVVPGCQEWVSVIECISVVLMLANIRTLITPLIKMVEYIPLIYTNLK